MEVTVNALSSSISTIQSGQRRVERAAAEIAGTAASAPSTPPQSQSNATPQSSADKRPDLAQSLVELRVGQHQAQAGARLVQTADEVLGTLIDTSA